MFKKIGLLLDLLKEGREVSNPVFWKRLQSEGQPVVAALITAVFGLLKGTKYEIPMDDATAMALGGSIFFVVNWVLTKITSKKVGLSATTTSVPAVQQAHTEATANVQAESKAAYTEEQLAEARKAMEESRGRGKGGDFDNPTLNNDYRN